MDNVSVEVRSKIMTAVKGRNTQPELAVRKIVHRLGYRYRLHVTSMPGSPDMVLPRHRTIIFVHGCFWHRHDCPRATLPASNRGMWAAKFARNVARDASTKRKLRRAGWRVLTVWECELKDVDRVTNRLFRQLAAKR